MALATESPRLGGAEAPPFDKGGFVLCTYCTAVTIPGFGGAVTICRRFPWEIATGGTPAAGTARKGSLAKGSWHAVGVTEGSHSRHFPKVQTNVETCHPGESPRFGFAKPPPFGKGGFGLRFYFNPVTLPGTGGAVTIC